MRKVFWGFLCERGCHKKLVQLLYFTGNGLCTTMRLLPDKNFFLFIWKFKYFKAKTSAIASIPKIIYLVKKTALKTTKTFKLFLLAIAFISIKNRAFSQNTDKQNPIIFLEESIGGAFGAAGGFALGLGINYQVNRSLFTARYIGTARLSVGVLDPIVPLPILNVRNSMGEVAILYGVRFIEEGQSYSFSLGASYNDYYQYYDRAGNVNERDYNYFGVPFEANLKWFKSEKKRFRIYGLIPVGPPTGFGGSIGFKLFGNISNQSYAGITLSIGLGLHKVYE